MTVISHNCPTCSAPLLFDIDTQDWTCDYCKRSFSIDELKKYIDKKEDYADSYNCENCGAEIVTYEDNLSATCVYCGSPAIIKGKLKGDYKPDFIVPFKHTKEEVIKTLFAQHKYLSPRRFFNIKNVQSINGVYIPYWLFSCSAETSIEGESYDCNRKKIYIKRKAIMEIDRIPADAKTKLNNEYLGGIEPFEYTKMKKFEYPYLAGFNAERYDINSDDTFEEQIKERIFDATINKMRLEDGFFYDSSAMEKETLLRDRKVEHVLMPVWCIHVSYMGKSYIYYVNDQNLIIAGKYPISIFKSLIIWGVIFLLFVFVSYLSAIGVVLEAVCMLAIVVAIAMYKMISAVRDYRIIHKNKVNAEYVKHKSFKFIEYKDIDIDDM